MAERSGEVVRVMIVEDDRDTLERLAEAISRDPRTLLTQTARTGSEAMAGLAAAQPHVLLVDLGLPDVHGTEVIRRAVRALPGCEAMVITVFDDERNVLASIEAGATGYVLKDCSGQELVARILELRAGGAPMSPGIARMVLERMRLKGSPEAATPAGAGQPMPVLSPRERDVLSLIARGYTYAEIATQLDISVNTVTSHIKNSYHRLAVHSGAAAVTRAAELGLLGPRGGDKGSTS